MFGLRKTQFQVNIFGARQRNAQTKSAETGVPQIVSLRVQYDTHTYRVEFEEGQVWLH